MNDTLEKEIALFLAMLPPESLLALIETTDQLQHWKQSRFFNTCISECWKARLNGRDDPLWPRLKSGELDRDFYNQIWLTVDYYQRLWELIQISFHHIRPELTRFELGDWPSSAYDLFCGVICENARNNFCRCLEPYCEFSAKKMVQKHQLLKKVREGKATKIQRQRALELKEQEPQNLLLFIVVSICKKKATGRQRVVKAKLQDFYTALSRLCDCEATRRRNLGSFAWKNGKLMRGSKPGGTYSEA